MTFILVNEIYIMDEGGANCLLSNVITTESECATAANQLQISYMESITSKKRPAGCYVWLSTNETWFNTVTNPSETTPENGAAGVCKGGILIYLIHLNHL